MRPAMAAVPLCSKCLSSDLLPVAEDGQDGRLGRVQQFERSLADQIHMERRDALLSSAAPFGRTLDTSTLPSIMMDYFELQTKYGPRLKCRGPPCPKFGHCGRAFPNVKACWNEHLADTSPVFPALPLNCPRLQPVEDVRRLRRPWQFINPQCSHRLDANARGATAMQVFKLTDVYSVYGGYVFNRTHMFNRNGCLRFLKTTLTPDMTVYHLKAVFNWDYRQAGNFYHFIIEAVPLLYAAAQLLPTLKDIPIAAKSDQWVVYDKIGVPIVGVPREDMWTIRVRAWEIIHADTMWQPMAQTCGGPNKALWTHLRRHHLLPPDGLPLFHRDWTLRSVPPLSDAAMAALPPDWVVVLGKRPMAKRALVNWEGLRDAVYESFERERIVLFQGDLAIMDARALFRRARLFVSGHGAAFANVIFMPLNSSIYEIRPKGCYNACYNNLAYACSVHYYLSFGEGTCYSSLRANLTHVRESLPVIAQRFRDEDAGLAEQ
ncbi:hypothetical protein CLOP_g21977 [Closterium sp. NIES-67]|nr:hypothetical protein CLOP_g14777 [Closterium sp. NIES-67]GJP65066.1 hypothetical protein CLOP_g21977 [Closterium sp. NIES-67]